jgi:alkanesulfonate monooxygenase SsuD/methylene tetrahydromethanopterin reductase-like flavin-dependent oxidoreductase (luciferase family)
VIRGLLLGDSVVYNGTRYRLPEPPRWPPRLLVSVEGPRTCEIAARLGDGAIFSLGASPAVLELMVAQLRECALSAGRDPDHMYVCAWLQAAMAPTRAAAVQQLRPQAGRTLLAAIKHSPGTALAQVVPALDETALARIAALERLQSSEYDLANELAELVGEPALMEFTVGGTPADCRAKVRRLLAVPGVSEVAFNIHGGAPRTSISEFVREVIHPLRPVPTAATVSQE